MDTMFSVALAMKIEIRVSVVKLLFLVSLSPLFDNWIDDFLSIHNYCSFLLVLVVLNPIGESISMQLCYSYQEQLWKNIHLLFSSSGVYKKYIDMHRHNNTSVINIHAMNSEPIWGCIAI